MKFIMSLVLAATFAAPAFASDKVSLTKKQEIEAIKKAGELKERMSNQQLNHEEKVNGKNAYRLNPVDDPNADTASTSEKTVKIKPWFPSVRKMRMTRQEIEREEMYCKGMTGKCRDVTRIATEPGGTAAGITVQIKTNFLGPKASQ